MDDRIDTREDPGIEATVDLMACKAGPCLGSSVSPRDSNEHSYSLFSNREEEPEPCESSDSPTDLLIKSGQPRLSLVRGDDELDDDGGLIELTPVDPTPEADAVVADTWPWLADMGPAAIEESDESPSISTALEGHYASDLISTEYAPTACGARPTSSELPHRRPMPSLPRPGEIAAVAQRVGSQFAGDARIRRTPEVPALMTTLPKSFTPGLPVKISGDRVSGSALSALVTASRSVATPVLSTPNFIASLAAATLPSTPAAPCKTPDTPKRIGGGKLVQTRLTWKPGDPFAEANRADGVPGRFRWELMLSTACGTAVFGIAFFWIMRMVF